MTSTSQFNQIKYQNEFNKKTYRRVSIIIKKDRKDILDKLDSVQSKSEYLIKLIEEDLKRG